MWSLGKRREASRLYNNLLIQNEDVLFNPRNPKNPDSKSGESG
jgi:hypothetical protein